jgi:hypothetical protein
MRRYDRYDRYDHEARLARPRPPGPLSGWFPGAWMAGAPMYGWGWWGEAWGWPPYGMTARYDLRDYHRGRPVDPRESGTYGREGDRLARRWAERYGYEVERTLRPEPPRRGGHGPRR